MHDVLDRQLGEGRARHVRQGHGVQCDVDPARLRRHGVGVVDDGELVEDVDLGHVGCVADVVRDRLEPAPRAAGQVDAGAGIRERACDGAADRPAAGALRGYLVILIGVGAT